MERLIYVSESRMIKDETESVLAKIVAGAETRNVELQVTGALLFTGAHFAQILEGPTASIAILLKALERDPRHANLRIVDQAPIRKRKFAEWQMAYSGPSQFVARYVNRLIDADTPFARQKASAWLTELATEFSKA